MSELDQDYFTLRQVNQAKYKRYSLPIYLMEELKKEHHILDFGCGLGHMVQMLIQKGYPHVTGHDNCKESIEVCQTLGFPFYAELESLLTTGKKFDRVLMSHVLEHIPPEEVFPVLTCIREKLLAPGGALIVMVPNAMSNTGCYWRYEDWTHYRLFTPGSLLYVLKRAGFSKLELLDPTCTAGLSWLKKSIKLFLLKLYVLHIDFWNKVTSSSYHKESPRVFSYEIRMKAST